jgi:hypothetical protein
MIRTISIGPRLPNISPTPRHRHQAWGSDGTDFFS